MTFSIDIGKFAPEISPQAAMVDEGQNVRFFSYDRAQAVFRKIKANIEAFEDAGMLDSYMATESVVLDGLFLFDPAMSEELTETAEMHRACLIAGAANPSASADAPQSPTAPPVPANAGPTTKGNFAMFNIDTGNTGSEGPWIAWSARGTQDGVIDPKSFYLRDENGKTPFAGFNGNGVVFDIDAMKTGWQKSEGIAGVAPEWKWGDSPASLPPQPGEDFKKGFSIPCAIGGGKTATWEQAGAAAWNALVGIVPALQQRPTAGVLPLVKMTGTKVQQFKRGSTVEPVLEVVKWVPRPDCMKEGFAVQTAEAAPAPKPAPAPAPVAEPEDAPF